MGIYFCDRRAHCYLRRVATVGGGGASGAPDVSGHGHFGTYSIRCIVTLGHAQFGT